MAGSRHATTPTGVAKDGITVTGAGIWKQSSASGGGGTWLKCKGMSWGSNLTVSKMLIGENVAGVTSCFQPVVSTTFNDCEFERPQ